MEMLEFMAAPIVMCVVLVGIHVQLGLHVVRRGVIFVDIALAQSSALGAGIGVALGMDVGTPMSGTIGLAMALVAAWVISLTRTRKERIPQEAFIGITYVVAAAATILVLSRLPHGGEDIEKLLVGSILWVNWGDVARTTVLYASLGGVFFLIRKPIERLSTDPEQARAAGVRLRLWDFVFYAMLGVVVTWSVQIAGVLLVFTFLVVPAVMAIMIGRGNLLLTGWLFGSAVSALGAVLSYLFDLPTGATIVCAFGVSLLILAALGFRPRPS
jgi:zinc/manganese transport system permease protein